MRFVGEADFLDFRAPFRIERNNTDIALACIRAAGTGSKIGGLGYEK